ncbi:MAG: hypothetical protein ACI351_00940 [Candidatus Avelusimicrobium sp.]|uniref:hypothetical protein n=1 Tax=Candidatus Avelusimicrobium sp. TaxID=3048833 RepID=UPI003F0E9163
MNKKFEWGKKRGVYMDVTDYAQNPAYQLPAEELNAFEKLDAAYRALVALLYNYVPNSGHPGGSISSGRMVEHLLYKEMAYSLKEPHRDDADIVSYAAGHKALGLYAMWALRSEAARIAKPELLPENEKLQLRLEDLLGFRHNKAQGTPLFKKFNVKPLGGHPEPFIPFVRTSTGASGVGDGSAVGLALAAADAYGANCPAVHIIEGEGGLTAGRVSEAAATAATAQLKNVVFHIDWNEASIESERVTADGENDGDYVQWNPMEFFFIHDFNVIRVPNGHDFNQIHAAQKLAAEISNHQPTAIVYRTVKGWRYGIEGKASHGSGHKFASEGFYAALSEFEQLFGVSFPRFSGDKTEENVEKFYWESLLTMRRALEGDKSLCAFLAQRLAEAAARLDDKKRSVRTDLGDCAKLYTFNPSDVPAEFVFEKGKPYTTRGVLGNVLAYLNKQTGGTLLTASADLYGSTGAGAVSKDFPDGFFNAVSNPQSRRLSAGGICEDGMSAVCTGISAFGKHAGVAASYGAFLAFEHVAARLHAIGVQSAREAGLCPNTFIMFNGHAGLPTGEDGPTHADPQSLQLLQGNFPKGACITAVPLEVDEIWPLVTKSLSLKPAVFAPFVVRPSYAFLDREALGMEPAQNAVNGVYYMRRAKGKAEGTLIVQGAGIGRIVAEELLPALNANGPDVNVVYAASRELFELLSEEEQEKILPLEYRHTAMGITDFTLPALEGWLLSQSGRRHTLFPHKNDVYLGSASAAKVYAEAGLDGKSLLKAVRAYAQDLKRDTAWR